MSPVPLRRRSTAKYVARLSRSRTACGDGETMLPSSPPHFSQHNPVFFRSLNVAPYPVALRLYSATPC